MLTNELKKGDMVVLANGWKARIEDNKKGTIRLATVYGFETEMGSVYAHDIEWFTPSGLDLMALGTAFRTTLPLRVKINHTPAQLKLKATIETLY